MGRKSQALALAEEQKKNIARPERLFHEINLLHLEGHYFTFDPKAAHVLLDPMKSVEKRLKNPKINEEQPIEVIPHPNYGKPSVFSYKVFQAILKKLSDYGYPAPETVSFGSREIMRLSNRSWYGAANAKELVKTLNQFKHTAINCWFYDKGTKTGANLSLSLVNKFLYTYKGRGSISYFTIWLDPWLIKSINNHYTFCLNFARTRTLSRLVSRSTNISTSTSLISTAKAIRKTLCSGRTTRRFAVLGSVASKCCGIVRRYFKSSSGGTSKRSRKRASSKAMRLKKTPVVMASTSPSVPVPVFLRTTTVSTAAGCSPSFHLLSSLMKTPFRSPEKSSCISTNSSMVVLMPT